MVKCPLCFEKYDKESHIPYVLVGCGHSVCDYCKQNMIKIGIKQCPICRKNINHYVRNYALCEYISINGGSILEISTKIKQLSHELHESAEAYESTIKQELTRQEIKKIRDVHLATIIEEKTKLEEEVSQLRSNILELNKRKKKFSEECYEEAREKIYQKIINETRSEKEKLDSIRKEISEMKPIIDDLTARKNELEKEVNSMEKKYTFDEFMEKFRSSMS